MSSAECEQVQGRNALNGTKWQCGFSGDNGDIEEDGGEHQSSENGGSESGGTNGGNEDNNNDAPPVINPDLDHPSDGD